MCDNYIVKLISNVVMRIVRRGRVGDSLGQIFDPDGSLLFTLQVLSNEI